MVGLHRYLRVVRTDRLCRENIHDRVHDGITSTLPVACLIGQTEYQRVRVNGVEACLSYFMRHSRHHEGCRQLDLRKQETK